MSSRIFLSYFTQRIQDVGSLCALQLSWIQCVSRCDLTYHLIKVWHADLVFINHLKLLSRHQVQTEVSETQKQRRRAAERLSFNLHKKHFQHRYTNLSSHLCTHKRAPPTHTHTEYIKVISEGLWGYCSSALFSVQSQQPHLSVTGRWTRALEGAVHNVLPNE